MTLISQRKGGKSSRGVHLASSEQPLLLGSKVPCVEWLRGNGALITIIVTPAASFHATPALVYF